jgi:excinuclease ABC subunit C
MPVPDQSFDPREFVRSLTHRPGIYRMLDARGEVLYVGKARDLRRRVGSYFGRKPLDGKTQAMLQTVARIDVTVTGTEQEALLLEYNLIKEHRPKYNVVLRDDKSYPYIHATTEQAFPRFEFHRGSRNLPGRFLGPFPNAGAVRQSLQILQKLFRVRQCSDSFFANRSRPCLQYQIHRCSAPCVGLIGAEEYQRDVGHAIRFIEGRNDAVLAELVERMEQASERLEFERAAQLRDQIADLRRVQEQQVIAAGADADIDSVAVAVEQGQYCVAVLMIRGGRVLGSRALFPRAAPDTAPAEILAAFLSQHYLAQPAPPEILVDDAIEDFGLLESAMTERAGHPVRIRQNLRGRRRRWLEMALANARQAAVSRAMAAATLTAQYEDLAAALELAAVPERIECFDISHTQGRETVASCVVFGPAGPLKTGYRRFNIREVAPGDDYGALAEAVRRRFARAQRGEAPVPDLLLIDGGRGQLSSVYAVLEELGYGEVPVFAIAKGVGRRAGREQIFRAGSARPMDLPEGTMARNLIQQVRDEAHRFAVTGHRRRRDRQRGGSILESIPGLGPRRRRALLQRFGGLQGIARAGVEDLQRTEGISRALAERIYGHFHESPPAALS